MNNLAQDAAELARAGWAFRDAVIKAWRLDRIVAWLARWHQQ